MEQQIYQIIGASLSWGLSRLIRNRILNLNEIKASNKIKDLPDQIPDNRKRAITGNEIYERQKRLYRFLNNSLPMAIGFLAIGGAITDIFTSHGKYTPALISFGILHFTDALNNSHK